MARVRANRPYVGLKSARRIADRGQVGRRNLRALIAVPVVLVAAVAPAAAAEVTDPFAGATQLIVEREPGLDASERAELRADAGVDFVRALPLPETEVVSVPGGDLQGALDALAGHPDVKHAEIDQLVQLEGSPDPMFNDQWSLAPTTATSPGSGLDVQRAWRVTKGAGQIVAVVDSGVLLDHPDLAGQFAMASAWDYVDADADPTDLHGHGTHVAGVIAATADNGVGISGIAPAAKILPLRVLDANGAGQLSNVVLAIDRAGKAGARTLNASFSTGTPSASLADVIAKYPNMVIVAAAGNRAINVDQAPVYPCALPAANVVCVGASAPEDALAAFSNIGAANVDLFAPGSQVLSTWNAPAPDGYARLSGTSMASPHVAAAVALVRASLPTATPAAVRQQLVATADRRPAFVGRAVSEGRLDIGEAVRQLQPEVVEAPTGVAGGCRSVRISGAIDVSNCGSSGETEEVPPVVPPSAPTAAVLAPVPAPTAPGAGASSPPLAARLISFRPRSSVISGCAVRSQRCRVRTASLDVNLSAAATVTQAIERNVCRARGCSWEVVVRRRTSLAAGISMWKISTRFGGRMLTPGSYRATVGLAGQQLALALKVR